MSCVLRKVQFLGRVLVFPKELSAPMLFMYAPLMLSQIFTMLSKIVRLLEEENIEMKLYTYLFVV